MLVKKDSDAARTMPLLSAAIAGLMGAGCGTREKEKIVEKPSIGIVSSTSVDTAMTLASFKSLCVTRGGLVQTHASCAGSNSCAGVSLHTGSGTLSEHSCRAANSCAGISCVVLPEDRGLSGAQILEGAPEIAMGAGESQCSYCHGPGKTKFVLPIPPDADADKRMTAFQEKTNDALVTSIAFGLHGTNADGTAYANMPGFHKIHSVEELKRVVTHLKSLPLDAQKWKVLP